MKETKNPAFTPGWSLPLLHPNGDLRSNFPNSPTLMSDSPSFGPRYSLHNDYVLS